MVGVLRALRTAAHFHSDISTPSEYPSPTPRNLTAGLRALSGSSGRPNSGQRRLRVFPQSQSRAHTLLSGLSDGHLGGAEICPLLCL